MKIIEIGGKNLNSLTGEWRVDFTHPAFESSGIFAITGPTGAGKSTILDALCMALYGKTPRLDKVTAGQNDIMSRHRGECSARVIFETRQGRYCAHWYQKRARKKSGGNLQPPKWEVSLLPEGTILEDSLRNMPARMEEITGMDFHRFTRSMLLAQGQFDSFLRAEKGDRGEMLEQITGTTIYSHISQKVHEYTTEQKAELDRLRGGMDSVSLMSKEEVEAVQKDRDAAKDEQETLQKGLAADSALRQRCIHKEALQKKQGDLSREIEEHTHREEAFAPQKKRLAWARRAADIEGLFQRCSTVRTQKKGEEKKLAEKENERPRLQKEYEEAQKKREEVERRIQAFERDKKEAQELFLQVRNLDKDIDTAQKELDRRTQEKKKVREKETSENECYTKVEDALKKLEKRREEVAAYLRQNASAKTLVASCEHLCDELSRYEALYGEIQRAQGELLGMDTTLKKYRETWRREKNACEEAEKGLKACEKEVAFQEKRLEEILKGRLLREYRSRREHLLEKRTYEEKIRSFSEERTKLKKDTPCPLCGAREHPFVTEYSSSVSEIDRELSELKDRITRAETAEEQLRTLGNKKEHLRDEEAQRRNTFTEVEAEGRRLREKREEQDAQEKKLRGQRDEWGKELREKLAPYGISLSSETTLSQVRTKLTGLRDTWLTYSEEAQNIEKEYIRLQQEREARHASREEIRTRLRECSEKLAEQTAFVEDLRKKRYELFGSRDVAEEEHILEEEGRNIHWDREAAQKEGETAQREYQRCTTQIEDILSKIQDIDTELGAVEKEFQKAREAAGFESEEALCAARMTVSEREELARREQELSEQRIGLSKSLEQVEADLAREEENPVEESRESLEARIGETEAALKKIQHRVSELDYTLREEERKKQERAQKQEEIARQEEEYARWSALHSLIGSADGKKFRTFAQSLTFRTMVAQANRELKKMSDRYILTMDEAEPLTLSVIDQYQGGEIRSTKNLSGGESFLISLALALGLSHMGGNRVRVDSLFLDEGFGTLDEDSLETAVNALSHLHEEGKTIGVISHVAALKDGIEPRIEIVPGVGGNSRITGPGCSMKKEPE